jgi:endonuclease YncB( thermonuclease family)
VSVEGVRWRITEVVSVTDGDTIRVFRARPEERDGRYYTLEDDKEKEPHGIPIRLVWVDTPERGDHPGYEKAKRDLDDWMDLHWWELDVVCYESGGWDRLMGDFITQDGESASQYMMIEKGWPPYVKGK